MNKSTKIKTINSICDFHYNSSVVGFYAANHQYSREIENDFKNIVKRCIKSIPKEEKSVELEHYGTTRYQVEEAREYKYFEELIRRKEHITLPAESNSINVELNQSELELAWGLLESIPNLFQTIQRHLGGDFVVQEAYHFVASNYNKDSKVNTSGFWHRDSVGRRIKIFVCLETTGHSPLTAVLPCTYLDPVPREWEMIRAGISSKENSNVTSQAMNQLNTRFESYKQVKQAYKTGDIILLDTNAIHRGVYAEEQNFIESYRHLLQISLIPKTTLDIQRKLNSICWAQKDVQYSDDLFKRIPLHTPPFYPHV